MLQKLVPQLFNMKALSGAAMYRFSEVRVHGGLKDQDRIFTNLYRDSDPYIVGATKRVPKLN